MYDFGGAGMVAEISNEVGPWVNNFACGSRVKTVTSVKNIEGNGLFGDPFRHGAGFALRGRAPQVNGNLAMDVSFGFEYFGRTTQDDRTLQQLIAHNPDELDIGDLQGVQSYCGIESRDFPFEHFNGNFAAGTAFGLNVVKIGGQQDSMYNIILKNFTSWGYQVSGAWIEYVNQYVMQNFRCVSGNVSGADGITIGNNAHGISIVDARTEWNNRGINFRGVNADISSNAVFTTSDPRYIVVGHESVSDTGAVVDTSPEQDVVIRTYTDETRPAPVSPSSDLPFILAQWDGQASYGASGERFSNAAGDVRGTYSVSDSIGADTRPLPSPYQDFLSIPISKAVEASAPYGGFPAFHSGLYAKFTAEGYWNYNDGQARKIVLHPLYIGDRVYGTPAKEIHAIEYTGTGGTSQGTFTRSANPPVIADQTLTTALNTPVTLTNLPSLATDADSDTLTIAPNYENTDFGDLVIDGNDVTYTPFNGFRGIDEGIVYITDGKGYETRCQIFIRVGLTTAAAIVAGGWTLTQATGNAVTFTLAATPPDSGGARILRTEYSTDNGATWRKLCYRWVPGPHVVSLTSAGAAMTSGQAFSQVQLRYKTDLPQTLGSDTKSITLD